MPIFVEFLEYTHSVYKTNLSSLFRFGIRVSNSDISLKVTDGCAVLHGYFDKPYGHAAAVSTIRTTEGVADFKDQSRVSAAIF